MIFAIYAIVAVGFLGYWAFHRDWENFWITAGVSIITGLLTVGVFPLAMQHQEVVSRTPLDVETIQRNGDPNGEKSYISFVKPDGTPMAIELSEESFDEFVVGNEAELIKTCGEPYWWGTPWVWQECNYKVVSPSLG